MGKILIIGGLGLAGLGLLVEAGLPLGRLPGDLRFQVGGATVFIPLASALLVSLIASLALWAAAALRR